MKKIVLSTMGAFFLTAVMFSCNQPKETEVSPTTAKAGEESLSVIDQMEKEEGVKFFKKDVLLEDETSGTKVLVRFASLGKSDLEDHLSIYDFQIKPIFDNSPSKALFDKANSNNNSSKNKSSLVITEVLSKVLPKNAVGYSLNIRMKPLINSELNKKAKLAYSREHEIISDEWPEELIISVVSGQSILYALDKKMTWLSSWKSFYESGGWYPLNGPNNTSHWLDGPQANGLSPWKVRIKISYDSMSPIYDSHGFTAVFYQR